MNRVNGANALAPGARATRGRTTRALTLAALVLGPSLWPRAARAQQTPTTDGTVVDSAAPRPDSMRPIRPPARSLRVAVLPIIGYAPETKTMGGVGVVALRRRTNADSADRPTTLGGSATYTQLDQITVGAGVEYWAPGNRWSVAASAQYARFPYKFYGVGGDTPDSLEEDYTPRTFGASIIAQRLVRSGLYLGGGYEFQRTTMLETDSGGALDAGDVIGSEGGNVSAATMLASWDTRDNIYAASRGTFLQLSGSLAGGALGSDFDFGRVSLDARRYVPIGTRRTLALQALAVTTSGDVPFDRLAQLGGQNLLRGYLQGRYRDKALAALQAELRTPLWRRFGAAVFAGAGVVGPRLTALESSDVKAAGGAGLRWALNRDERLNIRLDVGVGQHGSATYITLGEAF